MNFLRSHTFRTACLIFVARIFLQLLLWRVAGYEVLTVDDYLRLSVAENISRKWQWFPDPIFLPAYFWVYALPFKLGISPRVVGLGLTFLFSGLTSVFLYFVTLRLGAPRKAAWAAVILGSCQPLSLWIGGVPMSEALSGLLLLFTIFLAISERATAHCLAGLFLSLATLVRYEFWPLAGALSLWFFLTARSHSNLRRFIKSLLPFLGILLVIAWRWTKANPMGPATHVFQEVTGADRSVIEAQKVFWGLLAFAPFTVAAFFWIFANAIKWRQFASSARLVFFLLGALLATLAGFFVVGYFTLTFPPRLWYAPTLLAIPLGISLLDSKAVSLLSQRFLLTAFMAVGFYISVHPPLEVKEETISVATRLRNETPSGTKTLIEKSDLGWAVLWGLGGIQNSQFESDPPLQTDADYALTSTRKSREIFASSNSPFSLKWTVGKYSFFSRHGE